MALQRSASVLVPLFLCAIALVSLVYVGTSFVSPPKTAPSGFLQTATASGALVAMSGSLPALAADVDPAEAYQQKIITGGSYVVMFSLFLAGLLIQQAGGENIEKSSALPPGSQLPQNRARVHNFFKDNPTGVKSSDGNSEIIYGSMSPSDARDLDDLQSEWFPAECYPDGIPWCEKLLGHPGVIAVKAMMRSDATEAAAGAIVVLASRSAIETFTSISTVDDLQRHLTTPRSISWSEEPDTRELAYVISFGVVGELRRRGVASELLRRAMDQVQADAPQQPVVALDLIEYNEAAIQCYERAGFVRVKEKPEAYPGIGRRFYSSYLYGYFPRGA